MATATEPEPSPSLAPDPGTAPAPAGAGRRKAYEDLFLISFLILFFELACIRWFGSTVVFLTFFTNLALIACFLGMSVGCLAASRRQDFIAMVLPLAFLASGLAAATLWYYQNFPEVMVGVGDTGSPQQVYFGTEYRANNPGRFIIPVEAVGGIFFTLIALIFVGLGQVLGRSFDAIPNRVAAYTVNVLGSLVGIVAFGATSLAQLSPLYWFAIAVGGILYFARPWTPLQLISQLGLLVVVAIASGPAPDASAHVLWSPYYKVEYTVQNGAIWTNNIGHQQMVDLAETAPAYTIPHALNRDSGGKPFKEVLIIGAGSGNDVQAVLDAGAEHIDAVEIDPTINAIGRRDHPNHPYDDKRVTVHIDDGRSFLRKTDKQYDLVVYALVDSLVLHSGYSSLRLESFLFTEQAFRDIKARLKPDGAFAMYNVYRQGWVIGRLAEMAKRVFGSDPLVIALPNAEAIAPEDTKDNFTVLMVGNDQSDLVKRIRAKFDEAGSFWLNEVPGRGKALASGFSKEPPPPTAGATGEKDEWSRIAPAKVETAGVGRLPTDDWPFLYLREAKIPDLNIRFMAMVAAISLVILFAFAPVRKVRPSGRMFFLGAGFMLLETKGVVHLALLFGSTWMVNSVVFFAILVMILFSNLFVLAFKPQKLWPYYLLLLAGLLANVFIPVDTFLALGGAAKYVASCAVVFLPVFFAGVIFAASFRDSTRPDADLGSNIGGVILGGLSEYASLMLGFNGLLWIAIGYYALSAIFGMGGRKPAVALPSAA